MKEKESASILGDFQENHKQFHSIFKYQNQTDALVRMFKAKAKQIHIFTREKLQQQQHQ